MKYVVAVAALAGGCYALYLKDTKTGAGLIGFAGLLIDATDVLKALGIWKGAKVE